MTPPVFDDDEYPPSPSYPAYGNLKHSPPPTPQPDKEPMSETQLFEHDTPPVSPRPESPLFTTPPVFDDDEYPPSPTYKSAHTPPQVQPAALSPTASRTAETPVDDDVEEEIQLLSEDEEKASDRLSTKIAPEEAGRLEKLAALTMRQHVEKLARSGLTFAKRVFILNILSGKSGLDEVLWKEATEAAAALKRQGFVVLTSDCLQSFTNEMPSFVRNMLRAFPEFKTSHHDRNYTIHPLGFLGNPSAFHNDFIGYMRQNVLLVALYVIQFMFNDDIALKETLTFQQFMGETSYVGIGEETSRRPWYRTAKHQCEKKGCKEWTFGGWLNMSRQKQILSYIPGSHQLEKALTVDPTTKQQIYVPAGAFVLYNSSLIREDVAIKDVPSPVTRLHVFYRVSNDVPVPGARVRRRRVLEEQGVPMLFNRAYPVMYTGEQLEASPDKVKEFSEQFKDTALTESGLVPHVMWSLEEMELAKYASYDERIINTFDMSQYWDFDIIAQGKNRAIYEYDVKFSWMHALESIKEFEEKP